MAHQARKNRGHVQAPQDAILKNKKHHRAKVRKARSENAVEEVDFKDLHNEEQRGGNILTTTAILKEREKEAAAVTGVVDDLKNINSMGKSAARDFEDEEASLVGRWQEKILQFSGRYRPDFEKGIEDLNERTEKLRVRLGQVKLAFRRAAQDLKTGVQNAKHDLELSLQCARERFDKLAS